MLFKKDVLMYCNLSLEEMKINLQLVTRNLDQSFNNQQFEGEIGENEFKIYPLFNYSSREKLRPEINGFFLKNDDFNKILLKFRLPVELKYLLLFTLIINVGLILVMILMPTLINLPFWDKWWILLLVLIFSFYIFSCYFNFKVRKSINILKEVFNPSEKGL
jgi:hypothetical protein